MCGVHRCCNFFAYVVTAEAVVQRLNIVSFRVDAAVVRNHIAVIHNAIFCTFLMALRTLTYFPRRCATIRSCDRNLPINQLLCNTLTITMRTATVMIAGSCTTKMADRMSSRSQYAAVSVLGHSAAAKGI